jgi:hypothetical protein
MLDSQVPAWHAKACPLVSTPSSAVMPAEDSEHVRRPGHQVLPLAISSPLDSCNPPCCHWGSPHRSLPCTPMCGESLLCNQHRPSSSLSLGKVIIQFLRAWHRPVKNAVAPSKDVATIIVARHAKRKTVESAADRVSNSFESATETRLSVHIFSITQHPVIHICVQLVINFLAFATFSSLFSTMSVQRLSNTIRSESAAVTTLRSDLLSCFMITASVPNNQIHSQVTGSSSVGQACQKNNEIAP